MSAIIHPIDLQGAMRKTWREWLINGKLNGYEYKLVVSPEIETAGWTFRKEGRKNVNYILMGDKALDNLLAPLGDAEEMVSSLMHHELGHSRFTSRDFGRVEEALDKAGVPFDLYNLFEDCRMERLTADDLDLEFGWVKNILPKPSGFGAPDPSGLLLAVKNAEGKELEGCMRAYMDAAYTQKRICELDAFYVAQRITDYYYPKALACETAFDLVPLIMEFMKEFPDDQECNGGGGGKSESDIDLAKVLSEMSDEEFKEFLEACEVIASTIKEKGNNEGPGKCAPSEEQTKTVHEHSSADLLRYEGEPYDRNLMRRLLPKFERILIDDARNTATIRPSKRFHARNMVLGREKEYKRKDETAKKRKSVTLVYDCSGSMWHVMKDLKLIAAMLNAMARKHLAEGHVILSGTCGYHTIQLPMKDEDIDRIAGEYGGEGLQRTFAATLPILAKSDLVFCVTDAALTDDPIDYKMLKSKGIEVIGLYASEERVNLEQWFRKTIWRRDVVSLVDAIVQQIK